MDCKWGCVILVAPWIHLTEAAYEAPEDREIAKPWIETPIDWKAIRNHVPTCKITAIFSDDDLFVALSEADIFKKELSAKIIVEHSLSHIKDEAGIRDLQPALDEVLSMAGKE
jgi:predicted alpha/beta hydrolase family esterase